MLNRTARLSGSLACVIAVVGMGACGGVFGDPIGDRSTPEVDAGAAADARTGTSSSPASPPPSIGAPCDGGAWCWLSPSPTGDDIVAVSSGPTSNTVWAVTHTGTVLKTDASSSGAWSVERRPTAPIVGTGIVAMDDTHVFVSYADYLGEHRDSRGPEWGDGGGVLAFDGATWRTWASRFSAMVGVWAAPGASEVWAIGPQVVVALDATTLRPVSTESNPLPEPLRQVVGSTADDVWLFASEGSSAHWKAKRPIQQGTTDNWTSVSLPSGSSSRRFVASWRAADQLHAASLYGSAPATMEFFVLDQGAWRLEWTDAFPVDVCSWRLRARDFGSGHAIGLPNGGALIAPDDSRCAWVAGGTGYARMQLPFSSSAVGVSERMPRQSPPLYEVWAFGYGGHASRTLAQVLVNSVSLQRGPVVAEEGLRSLSIDSDANLWVLGDSKTIYRYDASGITRVEVPERSATTIFARTPRDVWVGAFPTRLSHFDGRSWQDVALPARPATGAAVRSVWASSASDVWVVSSDVSSSDVFHFDGSAWHTVDVKTPLAYVVAGRAANDVWIGGLHGTASHYDGTNFHDRSRGLPSDGTVFKLAPLAQGHAFALVQRADDAYPYRFNGESWNEIHTPDPTTTGSRVRALVARSDNDMQLVGVGGSRPGYGADWNDRSVIMHWDGQSLSTETMPGPGRALYDAAFAPDGRLFAVGAAGTVVYRDPQP